MLVELLLQCLHTIMASTQCSGLVIWFDLWLNLRTIGYSRSSLPEDYSARRTPSGLSPIAAWNNGTRYRGTASNTHLMDTPGIPNRVPNPQS